MKKLFVYLFTSFADNSPSAKTKNTRVDSVPLQELERFARVYQQVKKSYVEEVSDQELMDFAIKGMITQLDPHSMYMSRQEYQDLQASISGEFAGVGLEIDLKSDYITVVTPLDDSPASRAGIQTGDRIIRIDDQPVKGLKVSQVSRMLRGTKNTQVKVTVFRSDIEDPMEFLLTRELIKVKSVRSRMLDDYFYVRIASFQSNTGNDLDKIIDNHLNNNPHTKGVILDLRNNPGGDLHAAVAVVDTFLDGGLVTYTQGRLPDSNINYRAEMGDNTFGLPLVVMINDGSASASEIVAGALQDHRRAIIMGTRSFGKGSVQTANLIDEQHALKLTTSLYYTPLGRSIQAQGIIPDIVIEKMYLTRVEGIYQQTEADLNNHLNNKNKESESTSADRREKRISNLQLLQEDNQLQEALNLVKAASILKAQPKSSLAIPPRKASPN
jgi:carboxyl-terminal processing protease